MSECNRRQFLRTCAFAGVAWEVGFHHGYAWAARQAEKTPQPPPTGAAPPVLSMAQFRTSPTEAQAVAEEARQLTRRAIDNLGGMGRFISRGDVVWVKPNIGWDRTEEQAANTNPWVVATVVAMCLESGAKRVVVSDNPCNVAQRAFTRSGIHAACQKAGADVRLPDERRFKSVAIKGDVLKEWELYKDALDVDKLINVPIVKHHGLATVTLGMKNLMGVAGGSRNRFHQDLDRTVVDLAAFLKPTLVVMDAVRVLVANGPQGGDLGDVRRKDLVVAGTDQVAMDALGATLLGHKPQDIGHIREAAARGLGRMDFQSLSTARVEL